MQLPDNIVAMTAYYVSGKWHSFLWDDMAEAVSWCQISKALDPIMYKRNSYDTPIGEIECFAVFNYETWEPEF